MKTIKDIFGFFLGVFGGLGILFSASSLIKGGINTDKKTSTEYDFVDTSISLESTGSAVQNTNYSSVKAHASTSSSGSWVKGSYDRRGHYRKAHYRKKYSTSPHAFKNRMRSRVYYHTKGKYRRHKSS